MGSCCSRPLGEEHSPVRDEYWAVMEEPISGGRNALCLDEAALSVGLSDSDTPESIISLVIQKLERSLPFTESIKNSMDGIITELRMILDFLRDKKLGEGSSKLHYSIADVVEMCLDLNEMNKNKPGMIAFNSYYDEIKSEWGWIREVRKRILRVGVDGEEMRSENVVEEDDDVVGLENDVKLLLRKAIFNEEQVDKKYGLQISYIKGVAGIGKTTLARQVYSHAEVADQFDRHAWVCLSGGLSNKEVLMELIHQVVDCEELGNDSFLKKIMECASNRSMQQLLHQHLKGIRYFIVLDDFSKQTRLQSVLKVLPHEDIGSRLLLTGRTHDIESIIYYDHEMKPLDFDQSWRLFLQTLLCGNTSASEHEFSKQLENNGRDKLRKCGGLPSAIKELGRQLAKKRQSGYEWEQLLQSIDLGATLEALIAFMVQQQFEMEGLINDLRVILEFVRGKKLRVGSRLYYLICDVFDLAQGVENRGNVEPIRCWSKEVKYRILRSGVDAVEMRSGNTGVEVDDEDEDEDVLVGLRQDVELLLSKTIFNKDQSNCISTALITGMVGIGKTTLARQVYNHADVIDQFDRRAWVCVSTKLSVKEILVKLIQQVVNSEQLQQDSLLEKMESADSRCLQEMLCQHLQGMRYFIVLDNFHTEMNLEYILYGLPREDKGSRLLLTSSSASIGVGFNYTHWTKTLDSPKSWQLFLKIISRRGLKFPNRLESKGKEMLRKCGGLPLAIKVAGRQIAKQRRSGSEWEEVLESIDLGTIMESIESIYLKLDQESKSCFFHMAFFKESATIRIEKFEQILGIVVATATTHKTRSYLHNLVMECIVEIMDMKSIDSIIKSCRINAILHALSQKKAAEEIGFEILSNNGYNRPLLSPRHLGINDNLYSEPSLSTRHLVISCSRENFNYSLNNGNKLVSLFFHGGGHLDASLSSWKNLEQLKILDLEDFGLKILPKGTRTLMEIRYLGLRNNYIEKLPDSLGGLKKLEVLDIAQNFMVEVPDIIWKMGSLRQLYISDMICQKPIKIKVLHKLRTLMYISINNLTDEPSPFGMMASLYKLGIEGVYGNLDESKLFTKLASLRKLGWLILKGFRFRSMSYLDKLGKLRNLKILKLEGFIARLPTADNFPPRLQYLKLVNSSLDEDPMPLLGKVCFLAHLKLQNAYTGQQMVILHDDFPCLNFLCIKESWNLRDVQVGKGAMPNLKKLEIKSCPYLETLPEEIGSITNMEELSMVTTKNIATKIRKSALISKIQHVDINP